MRRVAQEFCGTDTLVCALGFSPLRHHPDELEGAPPLVSKGGLLRPNTTTSLLFAPKEA